MTESYRDEAGGEVEMADRHTVGAVNDCHVSSGQLCPPFQHQQLPDCRSL